MVYRMVAKDTVESQVLAVQAKKESLIQEVGFLFPPDFYSFCCWWTKFVVSLRKRDVWWAKFNWTGTELRFIHSFGNSTRDKLYFLGILLVFDGMYRLFVRFVVFVLVIHSHSSSDGIIIPDSCFLYCELPVIVPSQPQSKSKIPSRTQWEREILASVLHWFNSLLIRLSDIPKTIKSTHHCKQLLPKLVILLHSEVIGYDPL